MQLNSIEDLGTNKERFIFGRTTSLKFQRMKIMIVGLESVGVELVKNLIQLCPEVLTICDQSMVTLQDLDYNFAVRDSDINQVTRAQACEKLIKDQFTSSTSVINYDFNFNRYIENLRTTGTSNLPEQFIAQIDKHDLIIVADIISRSFVVEISKRLRDNCENATNRKFTQGLIWCGTIGLQFYLYEDYGPSFKIFDKDGQQAFPFNIEGITKGDPGIVRILRERPHNYHTGDFVCIHEVEGMVEVNGNQPRPIRVINQYEFSIEDTSQSPPYIKGGLVTQAKVPYRVKYISLEEQLNMPQFDRVNFYNNDPALMMRALTGHVALLSISKILESQFTCSEDDVVQYAENNFKIIILQLQNSNQQNIDQYKDNNITLNYSEPQMNWAQFQFDTKLCLNMVKDLNNKLFPLITMVGGLVALEVVKFSGKYTPFHQGPISYDFYRQQNNDSTRTPTTNERYQSQAKVFGPSINDKLAKLNVILVGLGGTGCEFLRVLAMMGVGTDPDGKIVIVDDDLVHKYNLKAHFWLNQESLNKPKTKVAQEKTWQINQNVNFEILSMKIGGEQDLPQDFDWKHTNLIISSINNTAGRRLLAKKSNDFDIPLLDQSMNNVSLITSVHKNHNEDFVGFDSELASDFSKETYTSFPYLPLHSLVWAKEQFYNQFAGFASEYENYIKDPSQFIQKMKPKLINQEGQVAILLVISRLVLEDKVMTLQNLITLAKEIFDFNFTIKIRRFLTKYPPDLKVNQEYFWVGYKKSPQQINFDVTNDAHMSFVQISALILAKIFNIPSDQALDVAYVKSILQAQYPEPKNYWNLNKEYNDQYVQDRLHKLETLNHPTHYKTTIINFEEDNTRNLYVEIIFLLTNLRSTVYQIQTMPKYKVQKYALDIHRGNPMMHTILVGYQCMQIYKLLSNVVNAKYQNLHFDMNKNLFQFTQG